MNLETIKQQEFILIDKPKGISSFDVIRILRKKLGIRKMGHAGTLDPNATGLMIIGLNQGTKKLNDFLKLDKTYIASILIGIKTDTFDIEGKVLEEKRVENLDIEKVKNELYKMLGKINLEVPIYSAIKINGKKLYDIARKGNKENIKPPIKEMEIYDIKFLKEYEENAFKVLDFELSVKSGTYIRSIVNELSIRLNIPMTLNNLRRIQIGEFNINDSIKLE